MRRLLLLWTLFLILLNSCTTLPISPTQTSSPAPSLPSPPSPASTRTPGLPAVSPAFSTPTVDLPLGQPEHPLLFALPPSNDGVVSEEVLQVITHLSHLTGYTILPYVPLSSRDTVNGLTAGSLHLAWVSPAAYLLAHQQGQADIALTAIVLGRDRSASQFLVNRERVQDRQFTLYFDPLTGNNLAEASVALAQFEGARPCWPDPYTLSGYIVPLGLLHHHGVHPKEGAFVQGHATVIKALYQDTAGTLCQFGATLADDRLSLATELPDVNQRVAVVWRSDPIIPFDGIAYAAILPDDLRLNLTTAFLVMARTEEGLTALRQAFQIDGLQPVDDTFYGPLRSLIDEAGVSLSDLIR